MRKINYFPFVALGVCFLFYFSLPNILSSTIRAFSTGKVIPNNFIPTKDEYEKTLSENERLKTELNAVLEWLLFDARFEKQVDLYKNLSEKKESHVVLKDFFQRRADELSDILQQKLLSIPCQVILREPVNWSSSLWVNVGSNQNENLGKLIITKNSPVIKGNTLIGIVEEVLSDRSRIRLISDSSLIPSVRAVRGNRQDIEIALQLDNLIDRMQAQEQLFLDKEEKERFIQACSSLKSRLFQSEKDLYLAKGELHGALTISNRKRSSYLKGEGFNYAFADEEGEAKSYSKEPLIQKGDLLVTTGYDGIFPKDLDVAIVTTVYPMNISDCTYKIEAKSTIGNLDDLATLYILPPVTENVISR